MSTMGPMNYGPPLYCSSKGVGFGDYNHLGGTHLGGTSDGRENGDIYIYIYLNVA